LTPAACEHLLITSRHYISRTPRPTLTHHNHITLPLPLFPYLPGILDYL
jgi:hypothetical protein